MLNICKFFYVKDIVIFPFLRSLSFQNCFHQIKLLVTLGKIFADYRQILGKGEISTDQITSQIRTDYYSYYRKLLLLLQSLFADKFMTFSSRECSLTT